MTFAPRFLCAIVPGLVALMFCKPGYANPRIVSKHKHWHVYCSEEQQKTTCQLVHPRWYSFSKNKKERLVTAFLGPGPNENAMFMISVENQTVSFDKLEIKVDGVVYDSPKMLCENQCFALIGVDGAEIDVFRRGRVMTLRQVNAQGKAYGPIIKVSLAGFTAADRAARSLEIRATQKPAVPWTISGGNTVTAKVPTGAYKNIRHTLGATCDPDRSADGVTLFLQFEDHPDLANVEYIAVWHTPDSEEETKIRWTPKQTEGRRPRFHAVGRSGADLVGTNQNRRKDGGSYCLD
jgi:invasion protein IalB